MPSSKKTKSNAPPPPRREHPFLVGATHKEASLIIRAGKACDQGPVTFIREAALYQAREVLGLKQPEGGE